MSAPITLIVGPEQMLRDQARSRVLAALDTDDRSIVELNTEGAAADLRAACEPTLFGSDVVVIVTGLESPDDAGAEEFLAQIVDPPDHVRWVCIHAGGVGGKRLVDALKKAGADVIECKAIKKGKATLELLSAEVTARKRRMTSDALAAYYLAVGHNLPMLLAGLDQLLDDVVEDPITIENVQEYFAGVADVAGWQISGHVWDRDAVKALTSLRHSLNNVGIGSTGVMTVAALSRGLRTIVAFGGLQQGLSEADVAQQLGIPPWQVKDVRRQWSRWSGDQRRLAAAIVSLADADAWIKGGLGGASLDDERKMFELEMLVTRVSARAN
jgi:DNA polymerase-3 subunit delta